MARTTKYFSGAVMAADGLGERQIRVRASSGVVDRAGDVLVPKGCRVTSDVPVFLDHDASIKSLVGRAKIIVTDGAVDALITFGEAGVQKEIDEACWKYKTGIATDVSVGFEPLDADRTKTGYLFKEWELVELSLVGVGCNQEAKVTEKALTKSERYTKGLYEVAELAALLQRFDWLEDCVEREAEYEGDNSPLPAMLQAIMVAMGQALIEMTIEEVGELLADEMEGEGVAKAARTRFLKSVRARVKAGRVLSSKNESDLSSARDLISGVLDQVAEGSASEAETEAKAARLRKAEALRLAVA